MKDKSGRELQVGDIIVYGHALGTCASLQYGIIKEIKSPKNIYNASREHARVRGTDQDWHKLAKLRNKDGTLQYGERILKVWAEQVPSEVLALLLEHMSSLKQE